MKHKKLIDEIRKNEQRKFYDESCKKILSDKAILAHILKACTEEFKNIDIKEIPSYIEPENKSDTIIGYNVEDNRISGAPIRYDLLFPVRIPNSEKTIDLIINIEAQNDIPGDYPILTRAMYYGHHLVAGQKNDPIGFTHSNYGEIKKVYSIWILIDPIKTLDDTITLFSMQPRDIKNHSQYDKKEYDLLNVVILNPKRNYQDDTQKDILDLLSTLFSIKIDSDRKINILIDKYDILMTEETIKEVKNMRHVLDTYYDDVVKMSREEGIKKGLIQGRKSGIQEGIQEGTSRAISRLISKGMSKEFILDLGYTEEEIKQAKS